MMFPIAIIVVLTATVVVLAGHALAGGQPWTPGQAPRRWNLWEKLVYAGVVLATALLATTGFAAAFRPAGLSGWLLFLHFAGAGPFMMALAAWSLTWAGPASAGCGSEAGSACGRLTCGQRLGFWAALGLGLVTVGPVLLSMMPWFSSHAQHTLITVHRYGGLALAVVLAGHVYASWRAAKTVTAVTVKEPAMVG